MTDIDNMALENEEILEVSTETQTTVKIADDVISVIASLAAAEVEGVAGMSGSLAGGIVERFGRKNLSKGIKVEASEESAVVSMNINVIYGFKIQDVCMAIQESVKNAIESMTGLFVKEVNIYVQGITFPQAAEEAEAEDVLADEIPEEVEL